MSNESSGGSGGIGLSGFIFLIFLVLKLTHVIDWSWWWVTAPLWISFLIGVVCLIILEVIKHKY